MQRCQGLALVYLKPSRAMSIGLLLEVLCPQQCTTCQRTANYPQPDCSECVIVNSATLVFHVSAFSFTFKNFADGAIITGFRLDIMLSFNADQVAFYQIKAAYISPDGTPRDSYERYSR